MNVGNDSPSPTTKTNRSDSRVTMDASRTLNAADPHPLVQRLRAFTRDCVAHGDMTPSAERMLHRIIEDEQAALAPQADMDLWPRIEMAIDASAVGRFAAEYCLPTCHAKRCKMVDPGQLDVLYKMFIDSVRDSVYKELLCKAVTEPDLGDAES